MDANQFLHYLMGSNIGGKLESALGINAKTREKEIASLMSTYFSKINDKLRDVITANLPIIYLVDVDVVVDSLINALNPNIDTANLEFYQIVQGIKEGGKVKPLINNEQLQELDDLVLERYILKYPQIVSKLNAAKKDIVNKLLLEFNKSITIDELASSMFSTLATIRNAAETAAKVASIDKDMYGAKTYLASAEHRAISQAGKEMREFFNKNTPAKLVNPSSIVSNFNSNTQALLVGPTFDDLVKKVNKVLKDSLTIELGHLGIIVAEYQNKPANKYVKQIVGLSIGNLANAGHTGVKVEGQVIGVNTPLVQETMVRIAQIDPSAAFSPQEWATKSGQIDCSIDLTKDTAENAKILLSGGISFVISMEATFNSQYLQAKEVSARNEIINRTLSSQALKLFKDVRNKLFTEKSRSILYSVLRFSPTVQETIIQNIVGIIDSKRKVKASKPKGTGNTNITTSKSNIANPTIPKNSSKTTLKKLNAINSSGGIPRSKKIASLASLQTLLNQALTEQVKKNMKKPALQNRTGRFAESARVERLSESRTGMITAFYSYMKNPYQTFEPGYRQGSEARNPKTLISKSIREIAAGLVGNRLRAVRI